MNKPEYRCLRCAHATPHGMVWRTSQGGVVCADEAMCAARCDREPRFGPPHLSVKRRKMLAELLAGRQE